MPPEVPLADAQQIILKRTSILTRIIGASEGHVALCRTVGDIRSAIAAGRFATVLHLEGAEAIDTDLDIVVRHVEDLIGRLGETRVGLNSDFDGAVVPNGVGSVAGAQATFQTLAARGFGSEALQAFAIGDWMRVLEMTIG